MAQYRLGSVSIRRGLSAVLGQGTSWQGVIEQGDLFNITGSSSVYTIASVLSDVYITLDRNYAGTTEQGRAYAITRDFTPRHNLPYLSPGDDSSAIIAKLIRVLDAILPAADGTSNNVTEQGAPGETIYPHLAWASDNTGDGFSLTPQDTSTYLGIATSASIIPPTDPTAYTWMRIAVIENIEEVNEQEGLTQELVDASIQTAINGLIDGAPDTLNTLQELATLLQSEQLSIAELLQNALTTEQVDTRISQWAREGNQALIPLNKLPPAPETGSTTFTELTDTPATLGNAGEVLVVNNDANELTFASAPASRVNITHQSVGIASVTHTVTLRVSRATSEPHIATRIVVTAGAIPAFQTGTSVILTGIVQVAYPSISVSANWSTIQAVRQGEFLSSDSNTVFLLGNTQIGASFALDLTDKVNIEGGEFALLLTYQNRARIAAAVPVTIRNLRIVETGRDYASLLQFVERSTPDSVRSIQGVVTGNSQAIDFTSTNVASLQHTVKGIKQKTDQLLESPVAHQTPIQFAFNDGELRDQQTLQQSDLTTSSSGRSAINIRVRAIYREGINLVRTKGQSLLSGNYDSILGTDDIVAGDDSFLTYQTLIDIPVGIAYTVFLDSTISGLDALQDIARNKRSLPPIQKFVADTRLVTEHIAVVEDGTLVKSTFAKSLAPLTITASSVISTVDSTRNLRHTYPVVVYNFPSTPTQEIELATNFLYITADGDVEAHHPTLQSLRTTTNYPTTRHFPVQGRYYRIGPFAADWTTNLISKSAEFIATIPSAATTMTLYMRAETNGNLAPTPVISTHRFDLSGAQSDGTDAISPDSTTLSISSHAHVTVRLVYRRNDDVIDIEFHPSLPDGSANPVDRAPFWYGVYVLFYLAYDTVQTIPPGIEKTKVGEASGPILLTKTRDAQTPTRTTLQIVSPFGLHKIARPTILASDSRTLLAQDSVIFKGSVSRTFEGTSNTYPTDAQCEELYQYATDPNLGLLQSIGRVLRSDVPIEWEGQKEAAASVLPHYVDLVKTARGTFSMPEGAQVFSILIDAHVDGGYNIFSRSMFLSADIKVGRTMTCYVHNTEGLVQPIDISFVVDSTRIDAASPEELQITFLGQPIIQGAGNVTLQIVSISYLTNTTAGEAK